MSTTPDDAFRAVSCVSMQVLIFALLVAGTLCNALSECPEPDYIWQSNGRCCGVVSCVEDEEVTPCDSDYSSDTCTHCPPGSSMPDKTNSRTITNCIIKKCAEGHTRLIAYSADTKDPNACPIYCECDITYEYCGTDPCDCTKKSCRFGTLLKQNCGCEPDSKSIQTTEVPEPGVTNQASSTISLLNGTGSSTEPTSNATVGTSEESSYNMLPVHIGVPAAVVVIGIVILVSYCIWKRQNTGEEEGTVEEFQELDSTDPHQETGGEEEGTVEEFQELDSTDPHQETGGEEEGTVEEFQELDSTDPHQETGGVTERLMDGGGDSPRANGVGPVRVTERLMDGGGDSPAEANGMGPVRLTERLVGSGGDSPAGAIGMGPVRLTERLVGSGGDSPAGAIGMGPVRLTEWMRDGGGDSPAGSIGVGPVRLTKWMRDGGGDSPAEANGVGPVRLTKWMRDGGGDSPAGSIGVGPVRLTERLVDSGGDSPAGAIGMGPVNARRVTYITNNYNINRTESVQFGNDTHSTVTVKHAQDTGPCNHGTGNAMIEDTDVKRMTCDETEQHTDHTGLDMGSESQSPHIKKQHGTSSSNFKGFLGHPS